jgi:hypothetical protein
MLSKQASRKENIKKLKENREGQKACRGEGGCQLDFTVLLPGHCKSSSGLLLN